MKHSQRQRHTQRAQGGSPAAGPERTSIAVELGNERPSQDHERGDAHRSQHGAHHGSGNQEENIPVEWRCGPSHDGIEEDVIEDVPDSPGNHHVSEALAGVAPGQATDRQEHDQSRQLADQFRCAQHVVGRQRIAPDREGPGPQACAGTTTVADSIQAMAAAKTTTRVHRPRLLMDRPLLVQWPNRRADYRRPQD